MCRNIKTLFNFEPPATEDEIHASALQFVRKLSGFNKPSQANAEAFELAAEEGLHLHGGIGYTWEANAHFFVRRARLLAVSAGNAEFWSRRLLAPAA